MAGLAISELSTSTYPREGANRNSAGAQDVQQGASIARDSTPTGSEGSGSMSTGGFHPTVIVWLGLVVAFVIWRIIYDMAE